MDSSGWLVLGGLGLAALYLWQQGSGGEGEDAGGGQPGAIDPSTGLPFISGGTGLTDPGYGGDGAASIGPGSPEAQAAAGGGESPFARFLRGATDPESAGTNVGFLAIAAAGGAGLAGARYLAKRGKLGSRGATEVPEGFRQPPAPDTPPRASAIEAPAARPTVSPRAQPTVTNLNFGPEAPPRAQPTVTSFNFGPEAPPARPAARPAVSPRAPAPKAGRFRFGPGLVVEGIAETAVVNAVSVVSGRGSLFAPPPKGKQRSTVPVRLDRITKTEERVY